MSDTPPNGSSNGSGEGRLRPPKLVPGRMGTRLVSIGALLERIEDQFNEEYGEDSPALREADTAGKRASLVLEVANYVLAVESVTLSPDEKADLLRQAISNLFGFGPLDPLFADPLVTTIALEGAAKAAVRYGHGQLTPIGALFEDEAQMRRIIARLLLRAGAELRPDQPYIEAGLSIESRPVCVNLVAPPVALTLNADIRVHPPVAPTLDDMVGRGILSSEGAAMLRTLAQSQHGLVVVGDTESGKTTLMSALAAHLPNPNGALAVERAGELRLPDAMRRRVVSWPVGENPGITFGDQIGAALRERPTALLLDEVRADSAEAIAPLLLEPDAPRQWWTFRSSYDAKRLQSALGMLARRADQGAGEATVHALYARLPFVITVRRFRDQLQVFSIGEWQYRDGYEYPDYVLLMQVVEGVLRETGKAPMRVL